MRAAPAPPSVVAALLAAAEAPCDRALVGLLAGAGLRPWEACALTVADVSADGLAVRAGHGPLRRLVLLGPHAPALVAAVGGRASGPVLVDERGRAVGPVAAAARVDALAGAAGVSPPPSLPELRAVGRFRREARPLQ